MSLAWSTRIALARQRGRFNASDWRDGTCWHTCSVSEHAPSFGRDMFGAPIDPTLRSLGIEFSLAVKANDFLKARAMNDAIETYSRQKQL